MEKIFSEAEAEIEKCAHEADWYAEHGPKVMTHGNEVNLCAIDHK